MTAGTRATPLIERIYGLDVIRGLCAIGVMAYHYSVYGFGVHYSGLGTLMVYLFFSLSGFVLHSVYAPQALSESMLKKFILARIFRIFPLFGAISIGVFIYYWVTLGFSHHILNRLLLNSTFLFGVTLPGLHSSTPGGWSIGVEFAFYVLFPLLLLLRTLPSLSIAFIGSLIVSHVYLYATTVFNQNYIPADQQWMHITQPATFLSFFLGGMLASLISQQLKFIVPVVVPICGLAVMGFGPSYTGQSMTRVYQEPLLWVGVVLFSTLITLLGARTRLGPVMQRFATFLGDISFSLYLLHMYVFWMVAKWLPVSSLSVSIAALSSLGVAWLCYRYFENPRRRIGRRFGQSSGAVSRHNEPQKQAAAIAGQ